MSIVFLSYLAFSVLAVLLERNRIRNSGPDLFTCFQGLWAIQTIIPGLIVTGVHSLGIQSVEINRAFFQRVFDDLDAGTASQVMLMSVLFYFTMHISRLVVVTRDRAHTEIPEPRYAMYVSMTAWTLVVGVGLLLCIKLLFLLGGGIDVYAKLIQFRAGSTIFDRTFMTANLYSLTQTFALIGVVGLAVCIKKRSVSGGIIALLCAIFFALMTASRRAFFVEGLLIYFVFVLEYRRLFLNSWLLVICSISVPIIMYGKELLSSIAFGGKVDFSDFGAGSIVRTVMDLGISTVESWATLIYLHEPFRFGIDHVLAVARRFPEGILGLDIAFPERIVRVSTEVFADINEADVPPGFIGQMWLNWGYLGPVFWGILFGLQIGALQILYGSVRLTIGAKALFVLLLYVVALPVNTGSLDFTFTVDMIVLILFLVMIVRVARVPLDVPDGNCRIARHV